MDRLVKLVKCCSKNKKVFLGDDTHYYYTQRSMNVSLPMWVWIKQPPNTWNHTYFEPKCYYLPKGAKRQDIKCSTFYTAPMSKYERELIKSQKTIDWSLNREDIDWDIIKVLIDFKP